MKKINKYIQWLLPIFGLFACEDDMDVYNSPDNRLNFVYELNTMADTVIPRTFVYEGEDRVLDTVWLEVVTMGFVEDYDRPFTLEQVKKGEGEQAVAGKHYIAFDDPLVTIHYKIPAGANGARVPVVLKRDPSLKEQEVTLGIKIGQNENFIPGYNAYQKKAIVYSEILIQPLYWNDFATYYFAGKYGKAKHQFMINATADMGIKINDDFFYSLVGNPTAGVDMGMTDYWFYFFTRKLLEENEARAARGEGPLREEPEPGETEGVLVKFTRYEF